MEDTTFINVLSHRSGRGSVKPKRLLVMAHFDREGPERGGARRSPECSPVRPQAGARPGSPLALLGASPSPRFALRARQTGPGGSPARPGPRGGQKARNASIGGPPGQNVPATRFFGLPD